MLRSRLIAFLAPLPLLVAAGCGGDDFASQPVGSGGTQGGDGGTDANAHDAAEGAVEDGGGGGDGGGDGGGSEDGGELLLGVPCSEGAECESGHCVDGVCCIESCGDCMRCDAPGEEGLCTPAASGDNPDGVCGPAGEACSGACDGAGSCLYPAQGNPCGPAACGPDAVDRVTRICDGSGACVDQVVSCAPFVCNTDTSDCFASCAGNAEACVPEAYCEGTQCADKLALGEPCAGGDACMSSYCVDGLCCDTLCEGTCESCALPGLQGACSPIASGEDPDGECTAADPICAGACNGASQCDFPDSATPCGEAYCQDSDNVQVVPLCDGVGQCTGVLTDCSLFKCEETLGVCFQSCAGDPEACVSEAYCDGDTCHAKKDNATLCGADYECLSGYCEETSNDWRCCNTECPEAMDCVSGECLCQGVICPVGEACVPWFRDLDQDTYGDSNSLVLGCEGTAPQDANGKDYVRNMDDCYDINAAARPGQTAWFEVHRGDGRFDYDCDQNEKKRFDDTMHATAECFDCKNWDCKSCGWFGYVYGTYAYQCKGMLTCGPLIWQSFKQSRQCGESGTLFECNHNVGECNDAETAHPNTVQSCQ